MPDDSLHQNLYDDLPFDEMEPREGGEITPELARKMFPVHEEPAIDTMDEPVIIESACPGWQPGGDHYPAIPTSPEEVSQELIDSVEAGAVAVHVHPRDESGNAQLSDEQLLADTLDPVFEECGEVVTLAHTWAPGDEESYHADYVTATKELLELGDGNKYCQGSLIIPPGQGGSAYHSLSSITEGVRYFEDNDVKPLFQLYDSHVVKDLKLKLFNKGEVSWDPFVMNINAGKHHAHAIHKDPWSQLQLISAMNTVRDTIDDSVVGVYAGGRNWLSMTVLGLISGATHFRVGIEDAYWLYPHRDDLIPKNSDAVKLVADLAEMLGREVITDPDRARDHLGMKYTS